MTSAWYELEKKMRAKRNDAKRRKSMYEKYSNPWKVCDARVGTWNQALNLLGRTRTDFDD